MVSFWCIPVYNAHLLTRCKNILGLWSFQWAFTIGVWWSKAKIRLNLVHISNCAAVVNIKDWLLQSKTDYVSINSSLMYRLVKTVYGNNEGITKTFRKLPPFRAYKVLQGPYALRSMSWIIFWKYRFKKKSLFSKNWMMHSCCMCCCTHQFSRLCL